MLTYITITGTFYYRTTPTKTPAAGVVIEFVPRTAARPDGTEVLLPKTLSVTLDNAGKIPVGFSVPTLPDGVYYTVREMFDGGRGKYTILVKPGDPATDLSSVAPVVPPPLLVSTRGPRGLPGPQPPLSGMVPYALGTASSGSGTKASREDHVHPMPSAGQIGAVDTSDPRLSDSREWTAATVTQVEAEAGTDTARKAWSVLRVWQAIAAWWATSSAKSKLDGIANGATANATDAQLRDRSTHTGTQSYSTITGLGSAATRNVGTTSGTVAAGDDARLSDARTPTAHTHPLSELQQSGATTNQVPQWDGSAWVPATVSGGGGGAWGSITGTLSAQTDLQSALDGKATSAQGAKADSALQPNAPITGATKTKITYGANGLVTAGADATTADISDSTDKRYVTDAQLVVIGNTSGTNTGDQTSVTGNAGTATALQTARTIDGQAFDGSTNITVVAPGTHAATGKATPVDADELPLVDSAASNVLKKLTWANLKATVKTYFDTLYAAISHTHPLSDLTQSGATTNQVPQWDGSAWVPTTVSGGGGGGAPSVRSASADAGGGSTYVYMGAADGGTLTSASAWTITRLTVDGGGGLTATKHATTNPSSVWNDYASLTYT